MPFVIPSPFSPQPSNREAQAGWNTHRVALGARDLLRAYLHGYLGVIERRYQLDDHLPVPAAKDFVATAQPDTGTPALGNTRVFAICPGVESTEDTPIGGYDAAFTLMVGIEVLNRKNRESVDVELSLYQEAIRECVLREGFTSFGSDSLINWNDEDTDLGNPDMALTQGAGISSFTVYLSDVIIGTDSLFPDGPPPDPYEPLSNEPLIQQVDYEITNTAIDDEL